MLYLAALSRRSGRSPGSALPRLAAPPPHAPRGDGASAPRHWCASPCGLGLRFAVRQNSGLDARPRPRFGCPPKRAASLAGRRSGKRSRRQKSLRLVVSAFLSSGGCPPAREEKTLRISRNAHPPAFPTPTHKCAKRSRVLLNHSAFNRLGSDDASQSRFIAL